MPGTAYIALFISSILIAASLVGCGQAQPPDEEPLETIDAALKSPRPENQQGGSSPAPSVPPTLTHTPIDTPPTETPDLQATIAAVVKATMEALPTPTPSPTATLMPLPATLEPTIPPTQAPTPPPKIGEVLYEADWSDGMNGWAGTPDWKQIPGMLASDGSPGRPVGQKITAPYQPETLDYAIEAEIQLLNPRCGATYKEFGIIARSEEEKGLIIGGTECPNAAIASTDHWPSSFFATIASQPFDPGAEWHTYRLEVKGNTIRLFVDEALLIETADNKHLSNGRVGLYSAGAQISVRSFKVFQL